jgi:hypothetical protein
LSLSLTGRQKFLSFTHESQTTLLSTMASVWWSAEGELPPLPKDKKSRHLVLFSTPGSSSLPSILRTAEERGWRLSLLFKTLDAGSTDATSPDATSLDAESPDAEVPKNRSFDEIHSEVRSLHAASSDVPQPETERPDRSNSGWFNGHLTWRGLLIRKEGKSADSQKRLSAPLLSFQLTLAEEIIRYGRPPWNRRDVRAV